MPRVMEFTQSLQSLAIFRADQLSIEGLVAAFNHTFAGYPVPITQTKSSLQAMIEADDIQLQSSLVVRDAGGEDVGIGLLAVRDSRGWVGGMAIAPTWRRRGLGAWLIARVLAQASVLGLETVELEVLEENTAAYHLYQRAGFQDVRLLTVFGGPLTPPPAQASGPSAALRKYSRMSPIELEEILRHFEEFHQVPGGWQRQQPALLHLAPRLEGLALWSSDEMDSVQAYLLSIPSGEGYVVMDFGSLALSHTERVREAVFLLQQLLHAVPEATIRAINMPPGDALGDALISLKCPAILRQHDMLIHLPLPNTHEALQV
jgi:ribosomal-protein-alanine N-acetyltransferase